MNEYLIIALNRSLKARILLCLRTEVVDKLSELKADFFDLQDGLAKFFE
jgi:hypothetical protein